MFDKFMNNYYFGKSGKGDFTPDDMPETRWQLFLETLRTRFSQLIRLNLIYLLIWLPTILVVAFSMSGALNVLASIQDETAVVETASTEAAEAVSSEATETVVATTDDGTEVVTTTTYTLDEGVDLLRSILFWMLVFLFPCIAITGPFTSGVSYVTRNWSRDEHAFIWSDFKDAMKANWKQSLPVSVITGLMPLVMYLGWTFYGEMAATTPLMVVPQVLILMIAMMWSLSVTYMHPMLITYELSFKDLLRNSILLSVARLPMSVGIRLLHCVPVLLLVGVSYLIGYLQWGLMLLFLYYMLIGFSLSRFVTASYTNGVFDRYINPKIEGAKINQGLREQDDDDDDDKDEDEEDKEAE